MAGVLFWKLLGFPIPFLFLTSGQLELLCADWCGLFAVSVKNWSRHVFSAEDASGFESGFETLTRTDAISSCGHSEHKTHHMRARWNLAFWLWASRFLTRLPEVKCYALTWPTALTQKVPQSRPSGRQMLLVSRCVRWPAAVPQPFHLQVTWSASCIRRKSEIYGADICWMTKVELILFPPCCSTASLWRANSAKGKESQRRVNECHRAETKSVQRNKICHLGMMQSEIKANTRPLNLQVWWTALCLLPGSESNSPGSPNKEN